jgi:transcriptional regulator with XRE-family HTH domain
MAIDSSGFINGESTNGQAYRASGDGVPRVLPCNGKQLVYYRKRRGFTQVQLAKLAGYSERLVRKAETGGTVQSLALRDLAATLSTADEPLTITDLACDPEHMARTILEAFATHKQAWVEHIGHLLADNAVLRCAGDPAKVPFAGEWHGREGFSQWAQLFFSILSAPEPGYYQPTYIVSGNQVVAWGKDWYEPPGVKCPPLWVSQRFEFRDGLLEVLEDQFDTDVGSESLARSRALGLLE